jgi:DNA-binding XRE family transcriptional regulator
MVDVNKLRGAMVAAGFNQNTLAKELGMSKNTLCNKLKKGVFLSSEISQMIALLNISDPISIFFTNNVS